MRQQFYEQENNPQHDRECASYEKQIAQLTKERNALRVEYESRAIWIAKMNKILGTENSDGFHCVDSHLAAQKIVDERDQLAAKCAEIRKLCNYAEHSAHCELGESPDKQCTCGLDELIEACK